MTGIEAVNKICVIKEQHTEQRTKEKKYAL